ncbi:raftlin isoform X1 [Pteropus vampyrus]|uniref:Raftlin isoform X1 n=1 Tax=Pteropus vampyrus TaxID=132908 RepID=A0A6P6CH84_PTEVA|nr:raftlin isoform X1 [Pteropus vampyrus]
MGCRLNKLEKRDDKRPGNIYSTLKRPQVETKIDVSYEYRFLDFTTLTAAELPRSSAVRLASLRDLPAQLLELYQQGFSLAALHPFVQPTHEQEKTPLEHIFRAILIKKTERSQKTDHNEDYILELDCCSSLVHQTDKKIIPEFIEKIQEAASRGLKFVGIIPQYHCSVNSAGSNPKADARDLRKEPGRVGDSENPGTPEEMDGSPEPSQGPGGEAPIAEQPSLPLEEGDAAEFSPLRVSKNLDGPDSDPSEVREEPLSGKMEIFTLFNKPKSHQECRQYYPVTIPLRVSTNGQTVSSLDANWLEHMSDHFRKGGVLVNAVFYLGMVNDSLRGLTDGVFIFEAVSPEDSKTMQGYDAIVVEQWTVLEVSVGLAGAFFFFVVQMVTVLFTCWICLWLLFSCGFPLKGSLTWVDPTRTPFVLSCPSFSSLQLGNGPHVSLSVGKTCGIRPFGVKDSSFINLPITENSK